MTPQIALYLLGAGLVPLITFMVWLTIQVTDLKRWVQAILMIQENPEKHGIGTVAVKRVIEENTLAIKALTHYVKWLSEQGTKGSVPPPLG